MHIKLGKVEAESQRFREMLNPKNIAKAITLGVSYMHQKQSAANQPKSTSLAGQDTTGFVSKPFLGKPRPLQLSPGADRFHNPKSFCWYFKDICHVKENCICLSRKPAKERQETNRVLVKSANHSQKEHSKLGSLYPRTQVREYMKVVH